MEKALLKTDLTGVGSPYRGKVRDVYDLDDALLIVATDRISAYDCVMPNGIPDKGKILTAMSLFWFRFLSDLVEHHVVTSDVEEFPDVLRSHAEVLKGRSMLVRKARRLDVECIVRGYLAGSGWKDYQKTGAISGVKLPEGLRESERLPEVIFTPSTKAEVGHDENISFDSMRDLVGAERADFMRAKSVELYRVAEAYASQRGIIIADTKFEFGLLNDSIILIDEILSPDSSRFWPREEYEPGRSQHSFDKQFVRDYLETLEWNKQPPAPELPEEIVSKTRERYIEAHKRLGIGDF
ncbi:MAG: phosphoribosylaminoimidazolesuccinocarboxamide synthase [Gemmatimonadota bacterium]|nr:MAG: phosphoribosylaminoimidazolesuccinocarboxamide synthase [Gemmatimonadota bacterium]